MAATKNKPVKSIYDLAMQTGLATSTISRVLNQRGRISMKTRQRVLAAAREAGFKPRMSARQTAVAVVLDRMRFNTYGGFISSLLTHLVDEFAVHDIAVEVYSENSVPRLGSRFIDGVVAMSWDKSTIEQLRSLHDVPVVVINRLDLPEFSAVASDHFQSGQLVADYLRNRGHHRIAFLAEERDWGAEQRLAGMSDTLRKHGIEMTSDMIGFTEHQAVYGTLRRLLVHKPTALFLAGEDLALEGTFILTDMLKVKVPDDLSIVGIENVKVSQYTRPPLTTMQQPLELIAQQAMQLVIEQIEGRQTNAKQLKLKNRMIERESTRTLI